MAIEAISGAGMTYQGSTSTVETRAEVRPKVEAAEQLQVSERLAQNTISIDTKSAGDRENGSQDTSSKQKEQIKKAIEEINRKANNSEAIFGIHEATNRVTIKLIDKDTKEVIKELPPEKTLDMIAKVWEMAGILVDEKR